MKGYKLNEYLGINHVFTCVKSRCSGKWRKINFFSVCVHTKCGRLTHL